MSKKQVIVNEWEKLNRISNRRLSVGESVKTIKMSWSIDRITIVGKLKENIYYHTQNDVLILDF
ncbi:replication protein, partial [Enterococcus durans]|nr:replication protein [Enterococcus durans]